MVQKQQRIPHKAQTISEIQSEQKEPQKIWNNRKRKKIAKLLNIEIDTIDGEMTMTEKAKQLPWTNLNINLDFQAS